MSFHARAIFLFSIATTIVLFGMAAQEPIITRVEGAPPGSSDLPLRGFLWSSNTGWISFCGGQNISNLCPGTTTYQVVVDNSSGEFRGHAWSPTLGWLSFNRREAGVPPEAPFNNGESFIARIDPSSSDKKMEGWGRFLSACNWDSVNERCASSGSGSNSGGWDGWVRFSEGVALNGEAYPGFVAASSGLNGVLTGNAWGGEVLGWVAARATGNYEPPPQAALPRISANLTANPTEGNAPLRVTLTTTVLTSSSLPITYSFDCDSNENSANTEERTFDSVSTTATFECNYLVPDNYNPIVTVYQDGVFATAQQFSLVTNINGGTITVRRGIIREIPADE